MSTEKFQVYKITNKVTGKIYIGGTTVGKDKRFSLHKDRASHGFESPLYRAIREYGEEQFSIIIIEDCNSQEELNERERYWIATLSSTNPEIGYNSQLGGNIFRHTDLTKLRMSAVRKGKESKTKIAILQYLYDGTFIKEYPSLTEASKETGFARSKIIRSLQKKVVRPTATNPYIFIYKDETTGVQFKINPEDYYTSLDYKASLSEECLEKRNNNLVSDGDMSKLATAVEQYDLEGVLISKYYSIAEASRVSGVSTKSIRTQLNDPNYIKNLKKTSKTKYIWKKADKNDPDVKISKDTILERSSKKRSKLIQAFDAGGNLIKEYHNIKEFEAAEHADRRTMMASIIRDEPWRNYYWKITG